VIGQSPHPNPNVDEFSKQISYLPSNHFEVRFHNGAQHMLRFRTSAVSVKDGVVRMKIWETEDLFVSTLLKEKHFSFSVWIFDPEGRAEACLRTFEDYTIAEVEEFDLDWEAERSLQLLVRLEPAPLWVSPENVIPASPFEQEFDREQAEAVAEQAGLSGL
jgi:hypothetical protein